MGTCATSEDGKDLFPSWSLCSRSWRRALSRTPNNVLICCRQVGMHRKKEGINHEHQRKGTTYEDRNTTDATVCLATTLCLREVCRRGTPWGRCHQRPPCDHDRLPGEHRLTHRDCELAGRRRSRCYQIPLDATAHHAGERP